MASTVGGAELDEDALFDDVELPDVALPEVEVPAVEVAVEPLVRAVPAGRYTGPGSGLPVTTTVSR